MEDLISLLDYAACREIEVDWVSMRRAESLSIPLEDDTFGIAIDPNKVDSLPDELCKLAHEIGHCVTGAFYNRHSTFDLREKHENRADKWAIKKLLPFDEMKAAMQKGYTKPWELAEYFGVTEVFMRKALCLYAKGNLAVEYY